MAKKVFKKSVPTGVKVISVLYFIGTAVVLLSWLAFLFGASALNVLLEQALGKALPSGAVFISPLGIFFILSALFEQDLEVAGLISLLEVVFLLMIVVLGFFIARGLWKRQQWARIVAGIFAVLEVLLILLGPLQGEFGRIIGLIIHGCIGWYLFFNATVKKAFK